MMPSPAISSKAERLSISNVRCSQRTAFDCNSRRSVACQYRFGLQKEGGKFAANMSDLNARATYNGIRTGRRVSIADI